jgi:arylsulfatase A-like enzyme
VDSQIGRLLTALEESQLADNTIVVLWSDNGWHLGEKDITGKNSLWERSTHVPLIFAGPGVTAGQVCTNPAELLDVYPTLLDLVDGQTVSHLEGHSLMPQLKDASASREWPAITTHNRNNHSVRSTDFRYISYADGSEELYDLKNDPREWNNIADDANYSKIKAELKAQLPQNNTVMVPNSEHRTLQYDEETDTAIWEGKPVHREDPIPGL